VPTASRNSFGSGVWDPKLASRFDLEQYRSALRQGVNFMLMPQGGATRRPGTRYVNTLSEKGKAGRFRFNRDQQYLLHFRDERLDIYEDDVFITRIVSPWATEELDYLHAEAQLQDTLVICHKAHETSTYAPHRLFRGALRAFDPIKTTADSKIIRVYHPSHGLLDGDKIGISGVRREIALGSDPCEIVAGHRIEVEIGADHGYTTGDFIYFSGLEDFGTGPFVHAADLNKRHKVVAYTSTTVSFALGSALNIGDTGGGDNGIAYAKDIGGIGIDARINLAHTVRSVESELHSIPAVGTNPCKVFNSDPDQPILEIDLGYDAGFYAPAGYDGSDPYCDTVYLWGFTKVGTLATGIVAAEQINGYHKVLDADGTKIYIQVATLGTLDTVGGGSDGHWRAASFYEIELTGADATDTASDGGDNGRSWSLVSLAPDDERPYSLRNLPRFDFKDALSPAPANEVQRVRFVDFSAGDKYRIKFEVPARAFTTVPGNRSEGVYGLRAGFVLKTVELAYSAINTNNASLIQAAINDQLVAFNSLDPDTITVTYDADFGGTGDRYVFEFGTSLDFGDITVFGVTGTSSQAFQETTVEGGSTEEDIISDTRGWPSAAIFYERRLVFWGMPSRPATVLGSRQEQFYDFDVGTALPSDAIDATGAFEPILHVVDARGLFVLTSRGEVVVSGGSDKAAIQPDNISFENANTYGATDSRVEVLAGRPIYVDRTGRSIRQLGYSQESNSLESKDVSIFSQHLITGPVQLYVWRNEFGDYLFARNTDGTLAVLNLNVEQGVAGWTQWTIDGAVVDMVEVSDSLYIVTEREIDGDTRHFLEAFDFAMVTDCALTPAQLNQTNDLLLFAIGAEGYDTVPGYDHLEGATVQVRGSSHTLEDAVVTGGAIAPMSGDALFRTLALQAGLAIPTPTLEPMPPQNSKYSSIVSAEVDLFESRSVFVNGFRIRPYGPNEAATNSAPPFLTGLRRIQLRGWGERESVVITAPEPQKCFVRAIQMEVA